MATNIKKTNFEPAHVQRPQSGRPISKNYLSMIEHLRKCRIADANEYHISTKCPETQPPSSEMNNLNKMHYNEKMRSLKLREETSMKLLPSLDALELFAITSDNHHNGNKETCSPNSSRHWQRRILNYLSKKNHIVPATLSRSDIAEHKFETNTERYNRMALASQADEVEKYCKICNLYFTTNDKLARHLTENNSHSRLLRIVLDYFDLL